MAARKPVSINVLYILVIICLVAIGGLLAIIFQVKNNMSTLKSQIATQTNIVNMNYKCDGEKEISAMFMNGPSSTVMVNLPNNKSYNLMQTMSADGGRYANWDNSFVFWSKGNTAFVEQDGNQTYENCVETSSN